MQRCIVIALPMSISLYLIFCQAQCADIKSYLNITQKLRSETHGHDTNQHYPEFSDALVKLSTHARVIFRQFLHNFGEFLPFNIRNAAGTSLTKFFSPIAAFFFSVYFRASAPRMGCFQLQSPQDCVDEQIRRPRTAWCACTPMRWASATIESLF